MGRGGGGGRRGRVKVEGGRGGIPRWELRELRKGLAVTNSASF